MMNSYRQNKSRNGRLLVITTLVVFLFALDILTGGSIRHLLRGGVVVMAEWSGRVGASIKGSGLLATRASLEAKNRVLSEQLTQYEERAGGFEALRTENEELRALVHLIESLPSGTEGMTAPVVSSIRSSPYGTFLIGAGDSRGSLVLTSGGFGVGTVTDTGAHTAVVTEVFAPSATIEAIVGSASISAAGSGGGNARASVPRALSITVGQPVVAPAFGQRPIGIVGNVASSSASASQDVSIVLPVNLASLKYVYILPVRN